MTLERLRRELILENRFPAGARCACGWDDPRALVDGQPGGWHRSPADGLRSFLCYRCLNRGARGDGAEVHHLGGHDNGAYGRVVLLDANWHRVASWEQYDYWPDLGPGTSWRPERHRLGLLALLDEATLRALLGRDTYNALGVPRVPLALVETLSLYQEELRMVNDPPRECFHLPIPGGSVHFFPLNQTEERLLWGYQRALATFLETGDTAALRGFGRLTVVDSFDQPHRFVTDPATLIRLAQAGEISFDWTFTDHE
jgi:hypothetical protein